MSMSPPQATFTRIGTDEHSAPFSEIGNPLLILEGGKEEEKASNNHNNSSCSLPVIVDEDDELEMGRSTKDVAMSSSSSRQQSKRGEIHVAVLIENNNDDDPAVNASIIQPPSHHQPLHHVDDPSLLHIEEKMRSEIASRNEEAKYQMQYVPSPSTTQLAAQKTSEPSLPATTTNGVIKKNEYTADVALIPMDDSFVAQRIKDKNKQQQDSSSSFPPTTAEISSTNEKPNDKMNNDHDVANMKLDNTISPIIPPPPAIISAEQLMQMHSEIASRKEEFNHQKQSLEKQKSELMDIENQLPSSSQKQTQKNNNKNKNNNNNNNNQQQQREQQQRGHGAIISAVAAAAAASLPKSESQSVSAGTAGTGINRENTSKRVNNNDNKKKKKSKKGGSSRNINDTTTTTPTTTEKKKSKKSNKTTTKTKNSSTKSNNNKSEADIIRFEANQTLLDNNSERNKVVADVKRSSMNKKVITNEDNNNNNKNNDNVEGSSKTGSSDNNNNNSNRKLLSNQSGSNKNSNKTPTPTTLRRRSNNNSNNTDTAEAAEKQQEQQESDAKTEHVSLLVDDQLNQVWKELELQKEELRIQKQYIENQQKDIENQKKDIVKQRGYFERLDKRTAKLKKKTMELKKDVANKKQGSTDGGDDDNCTINTESLHREVKKQIELVMEDAASRHGVDFPSRHGRDNLLNEDFQDLAHRSGIDFMESDYDCTNDDDDNDNEDDDDDYEDDDDNDNFDPNARYSENDFIDCEIPGENPYMPRERVARPSMYANKENPRKLFMFRTSSYSERKTPDGLERVEQGKLNEDTFSFMACSNAFSIPFLTGLLVFSMQCAASSMLAADLIKPSYINPLMIPANVETPVRCTQLLAIFIAILTEDDLRASIEQFIDGYGDDHIKNKFPESSYLKWLFACCCRFISGALGLIVTFFLIITVDTVFDLLLNFTAMEFVFYIDNVTFYLASTGFFGNRCMNKATEIKLKSFPLPSGEKKTTMAKLSLLMTLLSMLTAWSAVVHAQVGGKYLCNQILVEFSDNVIMDLGGFSGLYNIEKGTPSTNYRVQYFEVRGGTRGRGRDGDDSDSENNNNNDKRGRFAYCRKERAWTFNYGESTNPCEWIAKSSITDTFDIRKTLTLPWIAKERKSGVDVQLEYIQISCFDWELCKYDIYSDDNSVKDDVVAAPPNNFYDGFCDCPNGWFGIQCNIEDPCPYLEISSNLNGFTAGNRKWSKKYKMLLQDGNSTISSSSSSSGSSSSSNIQVYEHPIYVGEKEIPHSLRDHHIDEHIDLILYAGRRWLLTHTGHFDVLNVSSSSMNSHDTIVQYFSSKDFHISDLAPNSVLYVSEASRVSESPVGLRWYNTITSGDVTNSTSMIPYPDMNLPTDTTFFCGLCNNYTNKCQYEGVCSDGKCQCKEGASGTLCEISPLSNGICDGFFNRQEYNYDGGDCCSDTCNNLDSCGLNWVDFAFGYTLTNKGDGFPTCKDPTMVAMYIQLEQRMFPFASFKLVCNEKVVLSLNNFNIADSIQLVYVKENSECKAIMKAKNSFSYSIFYKNENNNEKATFAKGVTTRSIHEDREEQREFFVPKICLLHELTNFASLALEDEATSQSIEWLNTDEVGTTYCRLGEGGKDMKSSSLLFQRYLLALLYFSMNMDVVKKSTWLSDTDVCEWEPGILCNDDFINTIQFDSEQFRGSIATEIGLLSTLKNLKISNSDISGRLASEIGSLTTLEVLMLDSNEISGPIPSEIGNLANLVHLELSQNSLTGKIPSEIGLLSELRWFKAASNSLSGTITETLWLPEKLEEINLGFNQLDGLLTPNIGRLPILKKLLLHNNGFVGWIPKEIGNLINLTDLWLNNNNLSGSIPSEIENLHKLRILMLNDNNLSRLLPLGIGRLSELDYLAVFNNKISGQVPLGLCGNKTIIIDCEDLFCNHLLCNCQGMDAYLNPFECNGS